MLAIFLIMGNIFLHPIKHPKSLKKNDRKALERVGHWVFCNVEQGRTLGSFAVEVWNRLPPGSPSIPDG